MAEAPSSTGRFKPRDRSGHAEDALGKDHAQGDRGDFKLTGVCVICSSPLPSRLMIQSSSFPLRREMNAMRFPTVPGTFRRLDNPLALSGFFSIFQPDVQDFCGEATIYVTRHNNRFGIRCWRVGKNWPAMGCFRRLLL
jgi:hypothetical protein